MRDVLFANVAYAYLNSADARLLQQARAAAREAGLMNRALLPLSPTKCLWFTWTGTRIQQTIRLIASQAGLPTISPSRDNDIAIEFEAGQTQVIDRLRKALQRPPDAIALAARLPGKQRRKFDDCLTEQLLDRSLAEDAIDIPRALVQLGAICRDS